ncbi:MAG TPA: alpha/beta fold hydrolase [Thermoanaerobaculia bacterium]|nr:alpha/beta fold hydrolase [Thermoanaerobaculia bacterium]
MRPKIWKGFALVLGIGVPLFMLDAFARSALYPAPSVPVPSPPPPSLEEVRLDLSTGETVVGWARAAPSLPPDAPVVLFFHGNGENLQTMNWAGMFEDLEQLGVAYLAVDYPGYGRSSGKPSEEGLMATGDAAVAWARRQHSGRPVVLCGWSLGAATVIPTAARHPEDVRGLIALSPWTSLKDVASHHFPAFLVKALLRERYDSLEAARRIRVPALVIHGDLDDLIPAAQGKLVAEALAGPKKWVSLPGAGHNDLFARPEVWREIEAFLRSI